MDNTLNNNYQNFVPQTGMEVIGSDGEKIGDIDAVERDYFIVRKGFFFPQDHYIPLSAIASYDDNKVYLNVTKDGALEQDWSNPPATTTTTTQTEYVDTDVNRGDNWGQGTVDTNYVDTDVRRNDRLDDDKIEVVAEDLQAKKHEVERGSVGIHKNVIEERKEVEVPVTEEEVNITRRAVDRPVDGHDFQEGTIEIPLKGEEVSLEKNARVVEEIDVDKTAVQHNERVGGTVRREEVHVDGENVDIDRNNRTVRDNVDYTGDDRNLLEKGKDFVEDKANDGKDFIDRNNR